MSELLKAISSLFLRKVRVPFILARLVEFTWATLAVNPIERSLQTPSRKRFSVLAPVDKICRLDVTMALASTSALYGSLEVFNSYSLFINLFFSFQLFHFIFSLDLHIIFLSSLLSYVFIFFFYSSLLFFFLFFI